MKKFITSLFTATFTRKGKPFLPYIYIFVFLILIMIMYIMKLCGSKHLSDTFINNSLTLVITWVGILTAGSATDKYLNKKNNALEDENNEGN